MELYPLFVAIPLAIAFLAAVVPKKVERLADVLGIVGTLALGGLVILFFGKTGVVRLGGWAPPVGILMVLDPLSWLLLAAIAGVSLPVAVYSIRYMDRYTSRGKYYALLFLMIAGMTGVVVTGDLFNLFVFLEIASIASYALVAFGCEAEELEASFKYAVLGSLASVFVLFGVAVLYASFGTVNMAHAARGVAALGGLGQSRTAMFAAVFILSGFGLKAALVPFHAWLPDAHPSAPAPVSAMLSGLLIKAVGVYALVRVFFNVFGGGKELSYALMVLAALSMIGGVLMALAQWDFKRLLAYHSISQIGYVVLGIALGTSLGVAAGLFHLVNHSVFKSLLFLNAGAVEQATGTRDLRKMGGLREKMPVTAATSMVASMSIAGIPPFNGFFSKLLVIVACVHARFYGFALFAVIGSVLTLASFLKVQKYGFLGEPGEKHGSVREAPVTMLVAMVVLALACVGLSALFLPALRDAVLEPAARALLDGEAYVRAAGLVLGGAE